jgi:tRNA U34 5-methylaminomethyl-2-thiouridine-forming methyltransferase MnmC
MTLANFEKIQTSDGSYTLLSKEFNETCHSTSGAKTETELHYIIGCEVSRFFSENSVTNILEVGFGTGLGFLCTKEAWLKTLRQNHFEYLSFEKDTDLILHFLESYQYHFKKEVLSHEDKIYLYEFFDMGNLIRIVSGDARQSIHFILKKFPEYRAHAVYQDAFSPKRNAYLWTFEWFLDLKKLIHPMGILSTYSASSSIRKSLLHAGFYVKNGARFGKKRSSTRAQLFGESDTDILEHLKLSPAPTLTDEIAPIYILENNR